MQHPKDTLYVSCAAVHNLAASGCRKTSFEKFKKKKQKFLFIFKTFIFFKLTVLGLFNVVLSNFVRYIIG